MGNIFFKPSEEINNKVNFLMCPKCKKYDCSIRKKISSTGVESSILLIKCLKCDYIYEFNKKK